MDAASTLSSATAQALAPNAASVPDLLGVAPPPPPAPDGRDSLPPEERRLVDALYPVAAPEVKLDVPLAIAELRAGDMAHAFYGNAVDEDIQSWIDDGADRLVGEVTPEVRTAAATELSRMRNDLGLQPAEVKELLARGRALRDATPEQIEGNRVEARQLLRSAFGDGAEQALRDAQALVRRDPRVAHLLAESGLGDDPQTILKFAYLARTQRVAGRLK